MTTRSLACTLALAVLACGGDDPRAPRNAADAAAPDFEVPVLTNPDVPVRYPPNLYRDGTEGTVILQLYVDETGAVVTDSIRIAESSGIAAFDSAALAAVDAMRFAPARRGGVPVAGAFLQPVQFRLPDSTASEGAL